MSRRAILAIGIGISLVQIGCDRSPTQAHPAPAPSAQVADKAVAPASTAPQDGSAAPSASPKPQRPAQGLNVLLLTVDALRSDMPWSGYPKPIAPNLTRLAEQSVVYENHRSVSSYTAQTVATLLTGRFASTLYRTGMFFTNYFDSNDWITESMQKQGIRTMSVQAHLYFDRAPGLKQGFDVYQMVPGLTWNAQTDESVTSPKSVAEIRKLLENPDNTRGQFFLWSHLMDPHDQYVKHDESPDFGKDNRGRYDSEVWFADHWLGQLLDFCAKQPWWDKTAVIITADHGEAFGEHGMYKHAFELWDVLARVPLIIKAPGASAKRISLPRTHLDIAPTILDLMKVPAIEGFQGQSLAPEVYGETPPAPRPAIVIELAEDTNNPARRAIVVGDHKLISFDGGAKKSLFNLKDDPGELVDLSPQQPELVKQLDQQLTEYFKGLPVVRPFGGNKLRSGKIADGPKGPPKDQSTDKK